MAVSAIVLAGGRSARFGSDKLAAGLEGRPLLEHVLEAVRSVADEVVLSVPPQGAARYGSRTGASSLAVVEDPEPFGGPLVGLAAALEAATRPVAIVVGGDMPRLRVAVLEAMLGAMEPGTDAVVLGVGGDAKPLPVALRVEPARTAAAAALEAGDLSLRSLLARLSTTVLAEAVWLRLDPAGDSLVDVDRPADLDALEH